MTETSASQKREIREKIKKEEQLDSLIAKREKRPKKWVIQQVNPKIIELLALLEEEERKSRSILHKIGVWRSR